MNAVRIMLFSLVLFSLSSAYAISDYENEVKVNDDGSVSVYEKITFDLDQQYMEGFRSIRKEDFFRLTDIVIGDVRLNGGHIPSGLRLNGDKAEIVWKETRKGRNVIELRYNISNRVELFMDYARLCYEHYGAEWESASDFSAQFDPPPEASEEILYLVFSRKELGTRIDNSTLITEGKDLPAGNKVEGCYLFERSSMNTSKTVPAPAYIIFKFEQMDIYFQGIFSSGKPYAEWVCLPLFLLSAILALSLTLRERRRPRLMETLVPPGDDDPAVVTALVRNRYEIKELFSATMISLINRGIVEMAGPDKGGRLVLKQKKVSADLKEYEKTALWFVFCDKKQVDINADIQRFGTITDREVARKEKAAERFDGFSLRFPKLIKELFADEEMEELSNSAPFRKSTVIVSYIIVGIIILFFLGGSFSGQRLDWYLLNEEYYSLLIIGLTSLGFLFCAIISARRHIAPKVPQLDWNLGIYGKWDAFYRGLKSEKAREYPQALEDAWAKVLVYAIGLGMANKMKGHISSLSSQYPELWKRVSALSDLSIALMDYFDKAAALCKLASFEHKEEVSSEEEESG